MDEQKSAAAQPDDAAAAGGSPAEGQSALSDAPDDDGAAKGPSTEERMCVRCGVTPVDTAENPDSAYCAACRRELSSHSLTPTAILAPFLVLIVSLFSIWMFSGVTEAFSTAVKAQSALSGGRLYTAETELEALHTAYGNSDMASALLSRSDRYFCEKRSVNMFDLGYLSTVNEYLSRYFSADELSHPLTKSFSSMLAAVGVLQDEFNIDYASIYDDITMGDADGYTAAANKLSARLDELTAGTDAEPATLADSGVTVTSGPSGDRNVRICAVNYYLYYVSYVSGGSPDGQIGYLTSIEQTAPELNCLYRYYLEEAYFASGDLDNAMAQTDAMLALNSEDYDAYGTRSAILRARGDTDGAMTAAKAGEALSAEAYECQRQEAILDMLAGDLDDAHDILLSLYNDSSSLTLKAAETYAVCCNELGLDDELANVSALYSSNGLTHTETFNRYMAGELTMRDIFTSGGWDLT